MFRELRGKIGIIWCSLAHDSLMWPVHGYYECRACRRRYSAFADASEPTVSSNDLSLRTRTAGPSLSRA